VSPKISFGYNRIAYYQQSYTATQKLNITFVWRNKNVETTAFATIITEHIELITNILTGYINLLVTLFKFKQNY